jgi:hypothetical protein
MPSPPWGLGDIEGSDTNSKLIMNQPNGNTEVVLTGSMNSLHPNTVYTVYISNGWSTTEKWNVVGDWTIDFLIGGGTWTHSMSILSQDMWTGYFSGNGYYIPNPGYTWDIQASSRVVGDTFTLDLVYTGNNPGYNLHCIADIDSSGNLVNGICTGSSTGTWSTSAGQATKETVGNGWPGLFYNQQTFTFTTDENGAGSWHLNLRNSDFPGLGTYALSVWINEAGRTVLISDNFDVVVD